METSVYTLVKEIRGIRNTPTKHRKKRKNESDREYIFRKSRYRCNYCKRPFSEKELHAVRKHPHENLPLIFDGVCSCSRCAKEKGGLTHKEFIQALNYKKKEVRKEAFENTKELNRIIFEKYNYTCIYCTYEYGFMPKGQILTKDHKIPIAKGGTNDIRNLTCACKKHNSEKADRTADEYFKLIDKRKKRISSVKRIH